MTDRPKNKITFLSGRPGRSPAAAFIHSLERNVGVGGPQVAFQVTVLPNKAKRGPPHVYLPICCGGPLLALLGRTVT